MTDAEQWEEWVRATLKLRGDGRVKHFVEALMTPSVIHEAYPQSSRHVPVEWIEAYGLRIGVDAHGHAACVEFPEGAQHDG